MPEASGQQLQFVPGGPVLLGLEIPVGVPQVVGGRAMLSGGQGQGIQ